MSKIILQPCSNRDARTHYVDAIERPVKLSKIKDLVSREDFEILLQIYPSGSCFVWGVTPGRDNITKWSRIEHGDLTRFSREGGIFSSGTVTYKLINKGLASLLWGKNKAGETWEYLYFLDEIRINKIPT